jgi:chromate transporter
LTEAWDKPGPIRHLVVYFLRLGLLGFGGPVALVGQMERELVTERGWLSKEQMREAIAICQSLPGPLAIQVGIFIAWTDIGGEKPLYLQCKRALSSAPIRGVLNGIHYLG